MILCEILENFKDIFMIKVYVLFNCVVREDFYGLLEF